MTSDNVLKFLGNRDYLHQVSYQELKSLVVQYPYSLSLRYLLAMKSQQEDNTDVGRNIEMLATYGIDRTHLHEIFNEDPIVLEDLEETVIMGEDYLELKELSSLEREMESSFVENEVPSISFLAEEIPTPSTNTTIDSIVESEPIPTPPSIVESEIESIEIPATEMPPVTITESDSIVEKTIAASAIIGGAALLKNKETTEDLPEGKEKDLPVLESIAENKLKNEPESINLPALESIAENKPKNEPEIIETNNESEVEDEMENFIIMDFEEPMLSEVGIAISSDDLAPSESFSVQEKEIDENGLPPDAVEVNDRYAEKSTDEKKGPLSDLFKEVEEEVLAEEAVSDSEVYLDNPEELLIEESEKILAATNIPSETIPTTEVPVEKSIVTTSEKVEKIQKPRPQIPFEISYTKIDPVSLEEDNPVVVEEVEIPAVQAIIEETSEDISANPATLVEKEIPNEAAESPILPKPKQPRQPAETFRFESLDQFEATLSKDKLTSFTPTPPVPKSGFSSWQAQYSGVSALSGINLMPLDKSTGKVIKKKKKTVRKQFEKTVAFAEESLTMTEGIVSETLAQLLVKQGQYSQARVMYDKLCLIMPEKSSFFAGEIEKIQNLPDEPS